MIEGELISGWNCENLSYSIIRRRMEKMSIQKTKEKLILTFWGLYLKIAFRGPSCELILRDVLKYTFSR